MKQKCFAAIPMLLSGCVLVGVLEPAPAYAAPSSRHAPAPRPDAIRDFRALAQQRPWSCPPLPSTASGVLWPDTKTVCAWQSRLRKQTWSWNEDTGASCVSTQARWWHWAQAILPPTVQRSVWDGRWTKRTLHMTIGEEQRVLLLERDEKNRWQATEWRWNPNPRPATRRWQEGRWQRLLQAVSQPPFIGTVADTPGAASMRPVFRRVLGARSGEMHREGMTLESAGLCLQASNPLPGQPKLPLSYSPNDSRLEQRAAMHLHLSRQHPNAKWLTQFKMLEMPPKLPSGAKFLATWVEGGQIVSQLWMPAKGDAATVRVRITAQLPHGRDNGMATAEKAKPIVEHELEAIAVQWAATHE